jgi:peptidoglycan/xylan/chitin deacetylase (PgdA/CDA1 family)
MSVSPKNFAEQLQVIRNLATPLSLPALVQGLQDGTLPRLPAAVTMDDGYADNFYEARPILDKYEIPATTFVISGYLGQEFWWDRLVRLVFTEGAITNGNKLNVAGRSYEFTFQNDMPVQEQREQLLQTLYWALRPLPEQERQRSLETLGNLVGDIQADKICQRAMTTAELKMLADDPLIEIGSHTHTHVELANLTGEDQKYEIEQSREELSEIIGRRVAGISFPFGSFSKATQEIISGEKFTYACSSNPDTVRNAGQRYQLPRLWVPNLNGEQFSRWLRPWLPV